jgi:hypothetical protein
MLRSAASFYYTWDMHLAYNGQVRRDNKRNEICAYVVPKEESLATFATKGMSRRLGTEVKPSWALSFVHIVYLDKRFWEALSMARSPNYRHELILAGLANLLAYLGWLRSTELFSIDGDDVTVIPPADGPLHDLPPTACWCRSVQTLGGKQDQCLPGCGRGGRLLDSVRALGRL